MAEDKENFPLSRRGVSKLPKSQCMFQLIDLNESVNEVKKRKLEKGIDWEICVLCQNEKDEELIDPAGNKRSKKDEGFETLDRNLPEFQRLGQVPCKVNLQVLSTGPGIKENLKLNSAKWHKTCYLKCTDSKLERMRKRSSSENVWSSAQSLIVTRKGSGLNLSSCNIESTCMFCDKIGTRAKPLRKIKYEESVKLMMDTAIKKCDSKMLVQLQSWQGSWYHLACRTGYLYEEKSPETGLSSSAVRAHNSAFEHVVSHLQDVKQNVADPPAFSMKQLACMYESKLRENGVESSAHSTRLKEKLLEACPFLEACGTAGQHTLIVFRKDLDTSVRVECSQSSDDSIITKCARILRTALLKHSPPDWHDMSADCSTASSPQIVKRFLAMVMDGCEETSEDRAISTIGQLMVFHARQRPRGKSQARRHAAARETPASVYVAAKIYGATRQKLLVDRFFRLGICISYDRLTNILIQRANRACHQFKKEGVVAPISLQKNRFITGQVDNIDHNTSSATAKDAFHGTAITLMQHGPPGEDRQLFEDRASHTRELIGLPAEYTNVRQSFLEPKNARCPISQMRNVAASDPALEEQGWLEDCRSYVACNTWAGYHSTKAYYKPEHLTSSAIMPVFREQAATVSMMEHSITLIMRASRFLNPSQTPVVVGDLPIYTLCKEIQWLQPDAFGEDKVFVMMGGMHVELAAMRVLGDWLDASGWSELLVVAGITTKGRAESMISVSHLTRTRYMHQVTAAVLYSLKRKAYEAYAGDDPMTFEEWCAARRSIPQFRFWDITLHLQLVILKLVRALRTANVELYLEALILIVPWFFALDHQNYARWLPVHIRDLANLVTVNPALWGLFKAGYFVAMKTSRPFSAIALDQAHEQANATLKGNGGMIGLTEDPAALLKWMLSAPEIVDMTSKFEENVLECTEDLSDTHHLDTECARSAFARDKLALEEVIEKAGNPFAEESNDLYNIDTMRCCSDDVKSTVMTIEALGVDKYLTYVEERLKLGSVSIHTPIKQNKLPTFGFAPKVKQISKDKAHIKALKQDTKIFGSMCVAINSNRPAQLTEFFDSENQKFPPALADCLGNMHNGGKADLLNKCLLPLVETTTAAPTVDVKIYDGGAFIYNLKPGKLNVFFSDYVQNVFSPFILEEGKSVIRLDIVWDEYRLDSLKNATREKRGEGERIRVSAKTKLPKSWFNFLRNSDNKTELFQFLADSIPELDCNGTVVYCTRGENAVVNIRGQNTESLSSCNHEEADTRVFVHLTDACQQQGYSKFMIKTGDTDVVGLAVSAMAKLPNIDELWVHFINGKGPRKYIPVHEIFESLGPDTSVALPALHAFSGCDDVSGFFGIGKKTVWNALKLVPEAIEGFKKLSYGDVAGAEPVLQKLVMAMYCPSTSFESLSICRRVLFSTNKRSLENIPPTPHCLSLHLRRASLRAQIWRQITNKQQELPSPADWGWQKEGESWQPVWSTKPVMADASVTIVSCGCKVRCRGNCSCSKLGNSMGCCDLCTCPCPKSWENPS